MKVAVTGASGHIGNTLCRMLMEQGYKVKALVHHDVKALKGLQLDLVSGSVTSETDLANLCSGCETVFNLAACISIRKNDQACARLNIESCKTLVRAARAKGVRRIIHFSSIHAFRHEPLSVELNENRELELNSAVSYDRSKALSQKFMMEASSDDLAITVINPTAVMGPNDFKPSLTGNALIRLYKGSIPALIPGGYDWVDVRDVCMAAIKAISQGKPGACYLLGGSWQKLSFIAGEIEKWGGHRPPRLELPFWIARLGAPVFNLQAVLSKKPPLYTSVSLYTLKNSHNNISCNKANVDLAYSPRPFTETLRDTITWFRENNYI